MATTIESDVLVIRAGITAAMFVEHLAETTDAGIIVVEEGNKIFNLQERAASRQRYLAYQENPWPNDHIRINSHKRIAATNKPAINGVEPNF